MADARTRTVLGLGLGLGRLVYGEKANLGVPARKGTGRKLLEAQAEQLLVDGQRRGNHMVEGEVLAHRFRIDAMLELEDALRVECRVPGLDAARGAAVPTPSNLTAAVEVCHLCGAERR